MMFTDDDINENRSNIGLSSSLTTLIDDFHFPQPIISSKTDTYSHQYYQFESDWSKTTSSITTTNSNGKIKPKRRRIASLAQRRAANVRERNRMFSLNEA